MALLPPTPFKRHLSVFSLSCKTILASHLSKALPYLVLFSRDNRVCSEVMWGEASLLLTCLHVHCSCTWETFMSGRTTFCLKSQAHLWPGTQGVLGERWLPSFWGSRCLSLGCLFQLDLAPTLWLCPICVKGGGGGG